MNKSAVLKLIALIIIIPLALLSLSAYLYFQIQDLKDNKTPTEQVNVNKTEGIVEEVSKIILLPIDEEPTIATVKDVESLSNQPIFINAKNDDILLIYIKAKKAILYRPSEKKVIDVGPVNISQDTTTEKDK